MAHVGIVVLLVVAAVGVGTGDSPAADGGEPPEGEAITATCSNAIRGEADPKWRRRSTRAWRFGVYGPGRDFRDAQRFPRSALLSKIPVIVEGPESFVLKVPKSELGSVGLNYGPSSGARRIRNSATRVTFEPCADLNATGWPGGFLLRDRDPVRLKVQRESGDLRTIRVGRIR